MVYQDRRKTNCCSYSRP